MEFAATIGGEQDPTQLRIKIHFQLGNERLSKVQSKINDKFTVTLVRSGLVDLVIRLFRLN